MHRTVMDTNNLDWVVLRSLEEVVERILDSTKLDIERRSALEDKHRQQIAVVMDILVNQAHGLATMELVRRRFADRLVEL